VAITRIAGRFIRSGRDRAFAATADNMFKLIEANNWALSWKEIFFESELRETLSKHCEVSRRHLCSYIYTIPAFLL